MTTPLIQDGDAVNASNLVGHGTPVATSIRTDRLAGLTQRPEIIQRVSELKAKDNATNRAYMRRRRQYDPLFRITQAIKCRIRAVIKSKSLIRADRYNRLIGCTPNQLRDHLEAQFRPGMTWENYGKWEVDHIRPCRSFNLAIIQEQRDCFHFSNLQPLWLQENRSKSGKWTGDTSTKPRGYRLTLAGMRRKARNNWRKRVGMAEARHAKAWAKSIEAVTPVSDSIQPFSATRIPR
jgi:hypothetical protein